MVTVFFCVGVEETGVRALLKQLASSLYLICDLAPGALV